MLQCKDHQYYIDGVNVQELAQIYGTPLYVYDVSAIKERIHELKKTFLHAHSETTVSYAAKAFLCQGMVAMIQEEGLNLDVVSGGELYTALSAGFAPENIELNGNNKLDSELEMAVGHGVGKIIVDGADEIETLRDLTKKYDQKIKILFRITPGVDAHTHEYIATAAVDSKFGFPPTEVLPLVRSLQGDPHLSFHGYHFHIGSQLFDRDIYLKAIKALFPLIQETYDKVGPVKELNIGGGFGITYTHEVRHPYSYFLDPVLKLLDEFFGSLGERRPHLTIEPGRSLVGEAGYTIYRVGSIKRIPQVRTYVSIDGGMTDNIRPALYGATYGAVVHGKERDPEKVTLCGKCCESGDLIIRDITLPHLERGDLILVFSTGAYGYSMSSNYNHLPRPAVVFVKAGQHREVIRRETYSDLIARDRL